jgi:predicted nucleic acid-binding Zn ribbon protein
MTRARSCVVCGTAFGDDDRLVLMRGRKREEFCSEFCLRDTMHRRWKESAASKLRWVLRFALMAVLVSAGHELWHRFRLPQSQSISYDPPATRRAPVPYVGPTQYGPAWPPTDAEWIDLFDGARWVYPLPGPIRRATTTDSAIFGAEPAKGRAATCRTEGHCAVDLGGELWGEHVYAVQDGVVDRIQRDGNAGRGGAYVRLSHFGGYVFTQYFHLAAVPRTLGRGAHVKAGDVIGLLGDTGSNGPDRHLTFALSVLPSSAFPEVYWDPEDWMGEWPMHMPSHGTVAGFVPERRAEIPPPRHRR